MPPIAIGACAAQRFATTPDNTAMRQQGRVAFLPFVAVSWKASAHRPEPPPVTIGDHIRTARRERKLLQRQIAGEIGVTEATICKWEQNRSAPSITYMPAIIRFIGNDPSPIPSTLSERMRAFRRRFGLSIEQAARQAGVNESSWSEWERTGLIPWKRYRTLLNEFLLHAGQG